MRNVGDMASGGTQVDVRRVALFRIIARITLLTFVAFAGIYTLAGTLVPDFPSRPLAFLAVGAALLMALSLWLEPRVGLRWAAIICILALNVTIFVTALYLDGATSPIMVTLLVATMIAGLLLGHNGIVFSAIVQGSTLVILSLLETLALLQPFRLAGLPAQILHNLMVLTTLVVGVLILREFLVTSERALLLAQRRGEQLEVAHEQAEAAAANERRVRQREQQAAEQLRYAVQRYTSFLQQIAAGDYSARLDVVGLEDSEQPSELITLGRYLNETVETLVATLDDLQMLQRRYVAEAWERFLVSGAVEQGFRYQEGRLEIAPDVWIAPVEMLGMGKEVVVRNGSLLAPILVRGELIGALGVRRETAQAWTDEELEIVRALSDQLSQTMENLRLVEETQRTAANERLIGEVTARLRERLDVQAVLRTAARELRGVLDLARVEVRVGEVLEADEPMDAPLEQESEA